jgi:HEAT repeat protein
MESKQKSSSFEELDPLELSKSAQKKIAETKDKGERLKVLQSLAKLDALWTQNVLLNALADPHEEIRNYIVQQLAQKENLDLNLLYSRLSKPPWYIKTEILKILGIRKNPRSAKHIEVVLNESNDEVRRTAAAVLGNIGGEFARSLLVKLTRDQNPFVRKAAEKSLNETSNLKFL